MTQTLTYDEIRLGYRGETKVEVAQFRATWPNGNEPDGETTVVISAYGSDAIGYILICDDQDCGGSGREAGETVYATCDEAIAAAQAYAADHDEPAAQ